MLPHLGDISKIEVPVKDQYELKVNKSKKSVRIGSCNRLFFCHPLVSSTKLKIVPFQANYRHLVHLRAFFIPLIPAPNV